MNIDPKIKWKCDNCEEVFYEEQLLVSKNPFNNQIDINGCPDCFWIDGFERICDEVDCLITATCGYPVENEIVKYRHSCSKHGLPNFVAEPHLEALKKLMKGNE